MAVTVKATRVPSWLMKGIDVRPYIEAAVSRIGDELVTRHDRSRGLGARVNKLQVDPQPLMYSIATPLASPTQSIRENPRRTGSSFRKKNIGRFKGMATRTVKKYITDPLKGLWES